MTYRLGIDLGTTFTTAAVCHPARDGGVTTELVPLGTRSSAVPSVLFLDAAGTTLVGEAAERRALTDPARVVREFKRRMGDDTPIVVGDETHHAHDLAARLVRWVTDRVTEREGAPPEVTTITHPANWGPHRQALLRESLATVGIPDVLLLTEPQAAALQYASAERIPAGSVIAVYDLGGGTFDAAVLRKTERGFEMLGVPDGVDRLGGIDFDDMILGHVLAEVPQAAADCDMADPMVCSAISRLRRECTEAKEALSTDTEATIPVLLPNTPTQVRLVRSEFEALIRPTIEETIRSLRRAVGSADLTGDDLSAVLLVGGSSRIPLVTQMISAELRRPVSVDTDPKGVVAMGAALAGHHWITASTAETAVLDKPDKPGEPGQSGVDDLADAPARPDQECAPPELPAPRSRLRKTKITLGAVAVLVLALWLIPSPISLNNNTSNTGGQPARAQTPDAEGNPPGAPAPNGSGNGGGGGNGGRDGSSPDPGAPDQPNASPDAKAPVTTPTPGAPAPQPGGTTQPPIIDSTSGVQPHPATDAPAPNPETNTTPPPPPVTETEAPPPSGTPTPTEEAPPAPEAGAQPTPSTEVTQTTTPETV